MNESTLSHLEHSGQPDVAEELLQTQALIEGFSRRLCDPDASFEELQMIQEAALELRERLDKLQPVETQQGKDIEAGSNDLATQLLDPTTPIEELERLRQSIRQNETDKMI